MAGSLHRKLDQKIFRNSAMRTRNINVRPRVSRGGIRL